LFSSVMKDVIKASERSGGGAQPTGCTMRSH
jgi:hypothetical protein